MSWTPGCLHYKEAAGLNKGPADRVAKEVLEIALLVSHKGEQAQANGLGEDRAPRCARACLPHCGEGDPSTGSSRWKEMRK